MSGARLDWSRDGADWPDHPLSRMIETDGFRWRCVRMGAGPACLLIHGAGASAHSWSPILPLLAEHFDVLAMDLPDHGFTHAPRAFIPTIGAMAGAIENLVAAEGVDPALIIGHSAGAAIMLRLFGRARMANVKFGVSINGALAPFDGPAGFLFPMAAKLLHWNPFTAHFFAAGAGRRTRVERLIEGTGSRISKSGTDAYARLLRAPEHIRGALAMMAAWDLDTLRDEAARIETPLLFLAGKNDHATPPKVSRDFASVVRAGQFESLAGGHLLHEENPSACAASILSMAQSVDLI